MQRFKSCPELDFTFIWPYFFKKGVIKVIYLFFYTLLTAAFLTHCVVRGLDAAEGGTFLHHEAEQSGEDGGDWPRGVPSVWMEVCDGQT